LDCSISPDGRCVAFQSAATNLVPGDTNLTPDIFVRDSGAGRTELGSTGSGGTQGNDDSSGPSISADDRYVAFESVATNLVAGDTNGAKDILVRDRDTGTTERVSVSTGGVEGNGDSSNPAISSDGRFVAFDSVASNLVAGDTNAVADVFVRDRQLGTTTRVSVGSEGDGPSVNPSISAAGAVIAFESSATNLVAGDTNAAVDVFVRDLTASTTTRVSVGAGGAQGNGDSVNASISGDGLLVAFQSAASNLVTGDSNLTLDVFVRDRQLASTVRVSVDSGGTQGAGASTDPSISSDGRFVAFASAASNLVAGDSNLTLDVFVRDRQLASTVRASVDSGGTQGAGSSGGPSISADGRFVAFDSLASNLVLGDTNGFQDVFLRDEGTASAFESFCPGDGTVAHCPCGNNGTSGRGCQNSAGTGGALLTVTGVASLSADTVQFTSSGETTTAFGLAQPKGLSILLQGGGVIAPIHYGDGLRCAGGDLKRLYTKLSLGGVSIAPQAGDLSISVRSAQLNAPIPLGSTRPYQVYYRDGVAGFCPGPSGSSFNMSNGFLVAWGG
jgi:Tol biopolymer transport system component